jgi:uncharacterized protein with von Willebrand factor type A (vWA) domain
MLRASAHGRDRRHQLPPARTQSEAAGGDRRISGSMSRYSRMFLHFLHALTSGRDAANHRVHSFLFGALTHITRQLAARSGCRRARGRQSVDDWSGGTRIAGTARL